MDFTIIVSFLIYLNTFQVNSNIHTVMLTARLNDSSMIDDIDNTEFDQTIVDFVDKMDYD